MGISGLVLLGADKGIWRWTLITLKQEEEEAEEEEEEEQEEGSLLVSKQRRLQWSTEAWRLRGTQEMTDTVQLTAVTEAELYTVHFEKKKKVFPAHL